MIKKGVPQGSILGPLLFNVFINDIFYFIEHGTLYNYADDNTLSFSCPDFDRLIQVLQSESLILINWFQDNCMQANPDKFQAIVVGERTFEKKKLILKISDTEIICEEVVKLLGVDTDYKLNFDQHISNLCRKAGQQLNVLKRLSPFLSRLNKLTIFYTFILSNFNCRPLAWYFCNENNSRKLEKFRNVHYGLCRRILTSYEELLNKAKIPNLHVRRLRTMASETFKILNNMSPPVLSNLVRLRENTVYNFRYNNILQVPRVSTSKFGKKSFSYAAAVLWNSFPDEFRKVSNSVQSIQGFDFKLEWWRL